MSCLVSKKHIYSFSHIFVHFEAMACLVPVPENPFKSTTIEKTIYNFFFVITGFKLNGRCRTQSIQNVVNSIVDGRWHLIAVITFWPFYLNVDWEKQFHCFMKCTRKKTSFTNEWKRNWMINTSTCDWLSFIETRWKKVIWINCFWFLMHILF